MRYAPYDKGALAKRIRQYVDKERNYRNVNLTTGDTAKALGIARSTLIKVMQEEFGITFSQYLDKCRVQHARHLLMQKHTCHDLLHVANLVGFMSVNTLTRKFKAIYGFSISDLIKKPE